MSCSLLFHDHGMLEAGRDSEVSQPPCLKAKDIEEQRPGDLGLLSPTPWVSTLPGDSEPNSFQQGEEVKTEPTANDSTILNQEASSNIGRNGL